MPLDAPVMKIVCVMVLPLKLSVVFQRWPLSHLASIADHANRPTDRANHAEDAARASAGVMPVQSLKAR